MDKRIWFMWLQGEREMPEVVRMCYESWHKHNPGWDVTFLDNKKLDQYLDLSPILPFGKERVTKQALSDIIRINLLDKYGGLWVDATCYCNQPLEDWYVEKLTSGFFAFSRPAVDRMISSWFLGAIQNNELVKIYCANTNKFWASGIKPLSRVTRASLNLPQLRRLLLKKPYLWHSHFVTKVLRQYPYLWFHYLFEKLYREDTVFRGTWDMTPKISADIPHRLQTFGLFNPITSELKAEIDSNQAPLYKLSWKKDYAINNDKSVYTYLKKVHASV